MTKKLYRIPEGKVFCGVCSGLGEYFDIDPVVIRLLWLAFAFIAGSGIIAYIIAALIVPARPKIEGGGVHYE